MKLTRKQCAAIRADVKSKIRRFHHVEVGERYDLDLGYDESATYNCLLLPDGGGNSDLFDLIELHRLAGTEIPTDGRGRVKLDLYVYNVDELWGNLDCDIEPDGSFRVYDPFAPGEFRHHETL